MVLAYEMGLKPIEVKALTIREFNLMLTGYRRRQEEEWNHTRHIMAYVLNYGGMGTQQLYKPQDIWPLDLDTENEVKPIRTMQQALQLLKEYNGALRI